MMKEDLLYSNLLETLLGKFAGREEERKGTRGIKKGEKNNSWCSRIIWKIDGVFAIL